jgi:cytochrome c peroxidase
MLNWLNGYKMSFVAMATIWLALACGGGSVGEVVGDAVGEAIVAVNEQVTTNGINPDITADENGNLQFKPEVSLEEFVETCDKIPKEWVDRQKIVGADYVKFAVTDLPRHYFGDTESFISANVMDNTPDDHPITNEGAALGRSLFYDRSLSANETTSCSSCHQQEHGFSDRDRLSEGFAGELTDRRSPTLTNAKFYEKGKFFWDERSETLEHQVLQPIEDPIEMGATMAQVIARLQDKRRYPRLFTLAFGDEEVTSDRISKALSQFVRSMVSYQSKFDSAFDASGEPHFEEALTEQEQHGLSLFLGEPAESGVAFKCSACHTSVAMVAEDVQNIGLVNLGDEGAGGGKFKVPSLRNVGTRTFFMHDGRFDSLREVIRHYSTDIQNDPNLSFGLLTEDGTPLQPNYTRTEENALIAFLHTLTDETFLSARLFRDPFKRESKRGGDGR